MTRLMRLPEVLRQTGLARSTLYVLMDRGEFPVPVQLGERAVAWVDAEIDRWISAKVAARTGAAGR